MAPIQGGSEQDSWPPGTPCAYFTQKANAWVPAMVVGYDATAGTYNLDIRSQVTADRIRARRIGAPNPNFVPPPSTMTVPPKKGAETGRLAVDPLTAPTY